MARQVKKAKSAEKVAPATSSTSYSTRFDAAQRKVIEQAAKLLDCSPAKLIRDAAVCRAVDVVNGSGESEIAVRSLARKLVDHVFDVTVKMVDGDVPMVESSLYHHRKLSREESLDISDGECENLVSRICDGKALDQMRAAMETCGTEFVRILMQEWDRSGEVPPIYKPKVTADALLQGGKD